MVFWRLGRGWPGEDLTDLTPAPPLATAPGAPLGGPDVAPLIAGPAEGPASIDGPGAPATEKDFPTAAMAAIRSLGRVLVEPME